MGGAGFLFDSTNIQNAVTHANNVCAKYGVRIISINIISAFPSDQKLIQALAAGAIASAEAEQMELSAQGKAKALSIDSIAQADAARIRAQGLADAERIRAKGSIDAAAQIENSQVAIDLAKIQTTGVALDQKSTFFFGASAGDIGNAVLSNPGVVNTRI